MLRHYAIIGSLSGLLGSLGEWAGIPMPVLTLMVALTAVIWTYALSTRPQH